MAAQPPGDCATWGMLLPHVEAQSGRRLDGDSARREVGEIAIRGEAVTGQIRTAAGPEAPRAHRRLAALPATSAI